MDTTSEVHELIEQIEPAGRDAALTQRRALDKLIALDAEIAERQLAAVQAWTGTNDQRVQDQQALRTALAAVGVALDSSTGRYAAQINLW